MVFPTTPPTVTSLHIHPRHFFALITRGREALSDTIFLSLCFGVFLHTYTRIYTYTDFFLKVFFSFSHLSRDIFYSMPLYGIYVVALVRDVYRCCSHISYIISCTAIRLQFNKWNINIILRTARGDEFIILFLVR